MSAAAESIAAEPARQSRDVKTLAAARAEFARKRSPWLIAGVFDGAPCGAGVRRRPHLERRGRRRGDDRDLPARRMGDPRLPPPHEAVRVPRPAGRSARREGAPRPSPQAERPDDILLEPKDIAQLLFIAMPVSIAIWAVPLGLLTGAVPVGAIVTAALTTTALIGIYEWTHFLIHTSYRPRSRYYRDDLAHPPPAPLQERALLARNHEHRRRPRPRHLSGPGRRPEVEDRAHAGPRGGGGGFGRQLMSPTPA